MQLARKHPIAAACVIVGLIPVTAAQPVAGAGLGALGFGTGVGAGSSRLAFLPHTLHTSHLFTST